MQSLVGANREAPEECIGTESECLVAGTIVDSWVESARTADAFDRLVLQVAPRGRPKDVFIAEAPVSLVSVRLWLENLSENLCHGSPVLALGRSRSTISSRPRGCNWHGRLVPRIKVSLVAVWGQVPDHVDDGSFFRKGECLMLGMAITLAILALLAGLLGFFALAGTLAMVAKVLLFVFLALFVISLIFGRGRGAIV
jgi:uncharacterized membrane protein YtjA (UPF0391 family)